MECRQESIECQLFNKLILFSQRKVKGIIRIDLDGPLFASMTSSSCAAIQMKEKMENNRRKVDYKILNNIKMSIIFEPVFSSFVFFHFHRDLSHQKRSQLTQHAKCHSLCGSFSLFWCAKQHCRWNCIHTHIHNCQFNRSIFLLLHKTLICSIQIFEIDPGNQSKTNFLSWLIDSVFFFFSRGRMFVHCKRDNSGCFNNKRQNLSGKWKRTNAQLHIAVNLLLPHRRPKWVLFLLLLLFFYFLYWTHLTIVQHWVFI